MKITKDARIAIIGAGAAGITAAYRLKEKGYESVTVFERSGNIGGKCRTFTYKGKSFDLGANYITSSYKRVRKLAKKFGAKMYTEGSLNGYDANTKKEESLYKLLTSYTPLPQLIWQSVKYFIRRAKLSLTEPLLVPGFGKIEEYPELCQPFADWLDDNDMGGLKPVFSIPLTSMGYGALEEIPTIYALKYMTLGTFWDLSLSALGDPFRRWPKRFVDGYQRLFERISWGLDVRVSTEITQVNRSFNEVEITYKSSYNQILDKFEVETRTETFDYIIVATALTENALSGFMDFSKEEKELFSRVIIDPYVVVTYDTSGMEDITAATFVYPPPNFEHPYVITRQFKDNNLVSFYIRLDREKPLAKKEVLHNIQEFCKQLPGKTIGDYITYDDWNYFPHVLTDELEAGFYTQLEAMQGRNHTFYAGGLVAFELVEPIIEYTEYLIDRNFTCS